MRAEYIYGKDEWKARWRCVRCDRPLVRKTDDLVSIIRALCELCTHKLLYPAEVWSQHSYGIAIDVNT